MRYSVSTYNVYWNTSFTPQPQPLLTRRWYQKALLHPDIDPVLCTSRVPSSHLFPDALDCLKDKQSFSSSLSHMRLKLFLLSRWLIHTGRLKPFSGVFLKNFSSVCDLKIASKDGTGGPDVGEVSSKHVFSLIPLEWEKSRKTLVKVSGPKDSRIPSSSKCRENYPETKWGSFSALPCLLPSSSSLWSGGKYCHSVARWRYCSSFI